MSNYKPNETCQIKNLPEVYEKLFGMEKKDGVFVEVGAHDGISWSNTDFLARDLGWLGVYVEPILDLAEKCRENHANNHIFVFDCVISDHDGTEKLFLSSGISHTVNEETTKLRDPFGDPGERFSGSFLELASMTLNTLFECVPHVNLLVMDVEGAENKILSVFDINVWKPDVVIVEVNQFSGNLMVTQEFFTNAGYKFFQYDGLNLIMHK